jgi:hypothetical protein
VWRCEHLSIHKKKNEKKKYKVTGTARREGRGSVGQREEGDMALIIFIDKYYIQFLV